MSLENGNIPSNMPGADSLPEMPAMQPIDQGQVMPQMAQPEMVQQTVQQPVQQNVQVQQPVQQPVQQQVQVQQDPNMVQQPVQTQQVQQPVVNAQMANAQMPIQNDTVVVATEEVQPLVNEETMPQQDMPAMPSLPEQNNMVTNDVIIDPATQASIGGIGTEAAISQEEVANLNTQAEVKVQPIHVDGLTEVGDCPMSGWSGFLKILDFFAKDLGKDDVMSIDAGKMNTSKSGTFIRSDLSHYIGDITLNLTNPSQTYKKLKLLKGGDLIQIFKDDVLNKYIFCSIIEERISTKIGSKIAETDDEGSLTTVPELGNPMYSKAIGDKEIETIRNIIDAKNAMEDDEPYKFGFSKADNSLVSIGVGEDFAHYFQKSDIETVEFKCYYPFPINKMDGLTIKRFELPNAEGGVDTWIEIINNVDLTSIITTEKVSIVDNEIEGFSY